MSADQSSLTKFPAPFGKYLLTELIAVGGMAEVYRAKIFGASGFEKDMVVKRILPRYAKNPSFVQMLIDEAKIAVSLTHGNIVPIYELGELDGSYYIAMEYVAGRTILDVLRDAHAKRHAIPWPHCLGIAAEVARGLAYAHTRTGPDGHPLGLVHRDINPRNIVITPHGEVKILDFGIARASTKRHQTASGVIKGTPGYMSPEQMYGQGVDARSDVYCLGILTFELLTLRRLFPVWDVAEMRAVFEAGPIPPPTAINTDLPPEVNPVCMQALARSLTERFQSAGDLEEALRTVIARSGVAVTATGLARELAKLDSAPGMPAPKTSPPPPGSQPGPPTGALSAAPTTPMSGDAGATGGILAPHTMPIPTPGTGEGIGAEQTHAPADEKTSTFKLVDEDRMPSPTSPLAPLPTTSVAALAAVREGRVDVPVARTMVLAKNDDVDWAERIGEDAELLALARAAGAAPGQTRNQILVAAGLVVVAALALLGVFFEDVKGTIERAVSGKKMVEGQVVVKTIPSGAPVFLDGKAIGKTNLKVAGIDAEAAHQLVVKPEGMDPIIVEFAPTEFDTTMSPPTYVFERDFRPKPPSPEAPPPPPAPPPKRKR